MNKPTGFDGTFLPYTRQLVESDDIEAVAKVLRSDFLTTGPMVARFEEEFARRVEAKFAVACSSGTAALHLATMGLGLGPGDIAIVPALTFLATANAVRFTGAEVVFADVDAESGLLTTESLVDAVARVKDGRIRAVLPVHLGGVVADVAALVPVAEECGMAIVEDACHALGARVREGPVGGCASSTMAVFSTHPAKAITTGEGGLVTLNDGTLADRLRRLRSHGIDYEPARWLLPDQGLESGVPVPWYYEMAEIGCNYRLTDIACALGLSQLPKLARFIARRSALAARYRQLLEPFAPHVLPPHVGATLQPGWHLYAVRIDFAALGKTRGQVMRQLRLRGIGSQVHYVPLHMQPYYRQRYGELRLFGAESYYARTLSLPLFPGMADGDVDRVVSALVEALGLQ
jgi:UDP-4-amino-4,6-dideoxy-N-acetyl-beta-L-altrosamine transaminase